LAELIAREIFLSISRSNQLREEHMIYYSISGLRILALLFGLACASAATPVLSKDDGVWRHHGSEQFLIEVLSGRPDKITGGDALIRVTLRKNVALNQMSIKLNGADVTGALIADSGARTLTGLVTGMRLGENLLEVIDPRGNVQGKGRADADIVLTNYPIQGPVFSGPHEQPFFCETAAFNIGNGVLLGAPIDANCSVNTRVDYRYRTTAGAFAILTNLSVLPANVATTTTLEGKTVNYIVRVETGTVNRGIYQIAILHDPTKELAPDFRVHPEGWNKRLFYTFGGGCGGGWYAQGNTTGGVMVDQLLRQGYAVASSSLNVFSQNCNETTSTETQMMVKERFIEHYGVPLFTMGTRESAATYQMHHTTNVYPGILDGIIDAGSFPDSTGPEQPDAVVLQRYWNITAPGTFTQEQQRHVFGYRSWAAIENRAESGLRNDPTALFRAAVPVSARYNPVTNPDGARGTQPDHNINIYGADPVTGFGRRAYDNVGLQYGLASLNQGVITKTQFLDLNEKVGGFDIDFKPTAARLMGDIGAIRNLYQNGRVLDASAGIASTPIIDYRAYTDAQANGDQHVRFHSFSTRDRLIQANGNADNQVMFIEDNRFGLFSFNSPRVLEAISRMDQWLVNLKNDTSNDPQRTKVIRAKPAGLVDTCWSPDPTPVRVEEPQSYGNGNTTCNTYYPSFLSPRLVAGAPLANNILKCQLKPVDLNEYAVSFTVQEQARLAAIFPEGVCDYTKPGVEQTKLKGQWLSF
jgi:Tannase-like family of unknown function (DUF6351)